MPRNSELRGLRCARGACPCPCSPLPISAFAYPAMFRVARQSSKIIMLYRSNSDICAFWLATWLRSGDRLEECECECVCVSARNGLFQNSAGCCGSDSEPHRPKLSVFRGRCSFAFHGSGTTVATQLHNRLAVEIRTNAVHQNIVNLLNERYITRTPPLTVCLQLSLDMSNK